MSLNGHWETVEVASLEAGPPRRGWDDAEVPGVFQGVTGTQRWLRRSIDVPASWKGRAIYVRYDGVRWNSLHFWNGHIVGRCFEGFRPFEADATENVRFGRTNELLVGVRDWQGVFTAPMEIDPKKGWYANRAAPKDRVLSPIGGRFTGYGIWADVELLAVPSTHIRDVTIETSVRKSELHVTVGIRNTRREDIPVEVACRVAEEPSVVLEPTKIIVPAGETQTATLRVAWPSPKLWSPQSPHLYHLELELRHNDRRIDHVRERFGFREFWCDGPWFYLNGTRLTCRASSMWPLPAKTKADAAKRLRKLKAIHVHCFRTHTQPWRQLWYDAADEVGMLMIPEGPVWNDDGIYRVKDPQFWQHFGADIRGMVERMKNNPSVVAWSIENEMWGPRMNDDTPVAKAHLVELGRKLRQWDPTRPFTYESDGDPGGVADIIGIHYPHEMPDVWLYPNTCYWMDEPVAPGQHFTNGAERWQWRRRKPLYIGEYLWCPSPTPDGYSIMCGDRAYDDYERYRKIAIGRAWNMQTRAYRFYRVSGLCPWTCAGGSVDVQEDPMALAQAESMRSLAAFVKEYNTRFFGGCTVRRTLHVINDTPIEGDIRVQWRFEVDGKADRRGEFQVAMKPADLLARPFALRPPAVSKRAPATLTVSAEIPNGPTFHEQIACSVFPPASVAPPPNVSIGVLGGAHAVLDRLKELGLRFKSIPKSAAGPDDVDILVVAPNALNHDGDPNAPAELRIAPSSAIGGRLTSFVERGGRILLLAQRPGHRRVGPIRFTDRRSTMCFPLAPLHAILRDVERDDLKFWAPNHIVADAQIDRSDCGGRAIVVSGSKQGIEPCPLVECRVGKGVVLACGLRLLEALDQDPIAGVILRNALGYLATWGQRVGRGSGDDPAGELAVLTPEDDRCTRMRSRMERTGLTVPRIVSSPKRLPEATRSVLIGRGCSAETIGTVLERIGQKGGTVWWHRPTPDAFRTVVSRWNQTHELVAARGPMRLRRGHPVVDGLAQADLYWVKEHPATSARWAKTPEADTILDHAIVEPGRLDLTRARKIGPARLTPKGSPYNRPHEGGVILCTHGSVTAEVDFGQGGRTLIAVRAKGTSAEREWPRLDIRIDDTWRGQVNVDAAEPQFFSRVVDAPAGKHRLNLVFINDKQTANEDRNLWIAEVYVQPVGEDEASLTVHATPAGLASMPVGRGRLVVDLVRWDEPDERNEPRARRFLASILAKLGARAGRSVVASVEAETMAYQETAHNRPYGDVLALVTNGWARVPVVCGRPGEYVLRIHAEGSKALGAWPLLVVRLGGKEVGRVGIDAPTRRGYDLPIRIGPGTRTLQLEFVNDLCRPPEDRNIWLDRIEIWCAK